MTVFVLQANPSQTKPHWEFMKKSKFHKNFNKRRGERKEINAARVHLIAPKDF